MMIQQAQCPQCGETKLRRIRVKGIKKCSHCGTLVDTRRRFWWNKARSA